MMTAQAPRANPPRFARGVFVFGNSPQALFHDDFFV